MTNVFFMMLILASCVPFGRQSELHFEHRDPLREEVIPEVVTFAYLKRKVLTPHCISCHQEMSSEKKIKFWIVEGNADESDLLFFMQDGSMPPKRPATTYEMELVRRYIEQMVK